MAGERVVVRYRLPAGSVPPLTDVVGHLLETGPVLRVRTKRGDVVSIAADDVVTMKPLTAAPVRTGDIRNLEYAAALAWPGVEQQWLGGWLLRAAGGHTRRGNSAVPLGPEADASALSSIVAWYTMRGLKPLLSLPDRLFRPPDDAARHLETVVMVGELTAGPVDDTVRMTAAPDADWLRVYDRDVPASVLTAVVDGVVGFGRVADAAVGRAAVTDASDGTRWVGLSAVRVDEGHRRRGHARRLCAALLGWGAEHGATRSYVQVLTGNAAGATLFESLGFRVQHRSRYVVAGSVP